MYMAGQAERQVVSDLGQQGGDCLLNHYTLSSYQLHGLLLDMVEDNGRC